MTDYREPQANTASVAADESKQIAAMFETNAKAVSARDALISDGVSPSSIEIVDQSSLPADASEDVENRPQPGLWESIKRFFMPDEDAHVYAEGVRRGYALLIVRIDAADRTAGDRVLSLLELQNPVDVETQASDWRQSGWSGMDAGSAERDTLGADAAGRAPSTVGPAGRAATGEEAIPVYEERARVGKREVGRGSVRVRSYVVEEPVEQDIPLREEQVEVERRPVDRAATESDVAGQPFKDRTIEVTARGEEPVVTKEARVKEEVVVHKEPVERTETVKDSVRHTEVDVEDDRPTRPETTMPPGTRR